MAIKNILVIEDDRFIGEMYVRSLRHEGYDVDWVVDGNDGIVTALNKHYDVMLLDIMLPEKRGTEILKELRGNGEDKIAGTRVIVMTNFDQDTESRIAMQHDVDAYLIKAEITPRRLLEVIAHLDQQPSKTPDQPQA
jgi:DNA-binding response OmpR family regulator